MWTSGGGVAVRRSTPPTTNPSPLPRLFSDGPRLHKSNGPRPRRHRFGVGPATTSFGAPPPPVTVSGTARLRARPFVGSDAPFVRDLVTQPSWTANIGDRGVPTLDDARVYIEERLRPSHSADGFGFWAVERTDGVPIGLCGIVRRPGLDAPDLGYAFRPAFWGRGYAREAARATVRLAHERYGLRRLVAVVTLTNEASVRVLEAVGVRVRAGADVARRRRGGPALRPGTRRGRATSARGPRHWDVSGRRRGRKTAGSGAGWRATCPGRRRRASRRARRPGAPSAG